MKNEVQTREYYEQNVRTYVASNKIFNQLKAVKIFLYLLNFIPLIMIFIPSTSNAIKITSSFISLGLNVLSEFLSNILSDSKERAIRLKQLFETQITLTPFSYIEYDREMTNELHEISIRQGGTELYNPKRKTEYVGAYAVPSNIPEKYCYLFINRYDSSETKYLLGIMRILYGVLMSVIVTAAVIWLVVGTQFAINSIYYVVACWSLLIPVIRNFVTSGKNIRQCVKITADIDNFFADGDDSVGKLARFNYYIQSLTFEMRQSLILIPKFMRKIFKNRIAILDEGVQKRFLQALDNFQEQAAMKKGIARHNQTELVTLKTTQVIYEQKVYHPDTESATALVITSDKPKDAPKKPTTTRTKTPPKAAETATVEETKPDTTEKDTTTTPSKKKSGTETKKNTTKK